MRKEALVIVVMSLVGISGAAWADGLVGSLSSQGQALETPNQQRQRLGQPILASFPALEYGEKLETPNQRRQRTGVPSSVAAPTGAGVSAETPNQARMRITAAALLVQK